MKFTKKKSKAPGGRGLARVSEGLESPVDSRKIKRIEEYDEKVRRGDTKRVKGLSRLAAEVPGEEMDSNLPSNISLAKLRKRAVKMYLTFGKDLAPEYPTVESIIKRLAKSGIIRKTRLDNFYKIARGWAARDRWDYYRELVKERAMMSCRSNAITFQAACSAEVGKVMRTLEFSSKFLDQTVLLDLVKDRSTILAKLIMDAIVVEDISMKVFKKLAQKSILCSTLDAKEKLYMSASEAHQFLTSAQKTLMQFMAPQLKSAEEGAKFAEGGSGSGSTKSSSDNIPTVTTEAAKLFIDYWIKEKSASAAEKGVNKFGNRIQEAPKDSDFSQFTGPASEDAVIVSEEGSNKSSKR